MDVTTVFAIFVGTALAAATIVTIVLTPFVRGLAKGGADTRPSPIRVGLLVMSAMLAGILAGVVMLALTGSSWAIGIAMAITPPIIAGKTLPSRLQFDPPAPQPTMLKLFGIVLIGSAIIATVVSPWGIGRLAQLTGTEPESLPTQERLSALVNDMQAHLPKMVDEVTRLDTVSMPSDRHLEYHYTVLSPIADGVTAEEVRESLEEGMITDACSRAGIRRFMDEGVSITYLYSFSGLSHTVRFDMTAAHCP